MAWIEGVKGVLLDVDGTLLLGDRAIDGAGQTLERLDGAGLACRLTTNTTRRPRAAVAQVLRDAGVDVGEERVLAPSILARRRILDSGSTRAGLLVPAVSKVDFEGVEEVEDRPDWLVIGDLGRDFTWDVLNRAFRWLMDGARLLALQKNRYWHAGDDGLVMDAGAFIAALEYATRTEAEVVGKPSSGFFELALAVLGLPPREVLVVGDDVETDGRGGARAGCRTAVVRTGKFSERALAASGFRPDLVIDSVADLDPR